MDDRKRDDPQYGAWAARASQNHIMQARLRAQQANDFVREEKWQLAVEFLSMAFDHLLQSLSNPHVETSVRERIQQERELAYHRGVIDGKGSRPTR